MRKDHPQDFGWNPIMDAYEKKKKKPKKKNNATSTISKPNNKPL